MSSERNGMIGAFGCSPVCGMSYNVCGLIELLINTICLVVEGQKAIQHVAMEGVKYLVGFGFVRIVFFNHVILAIGSKCQEYVKNLKVVIHHLVTNVSRLLISSVSESVVSPPVSPQ